MDNFNLLNGNSKILMNSVKDESIDLVLTDPPYNISKKSDFKAMNRNGLDFGEWDGNFDQVGYLKDLATKIKKGGHLILFNAIENFGKIIHELNKYNMIFKDVIVWEKTNPMPRNRDRRLICSTELAVLLTKKGSKWTFNRTDEKYNKNVFTYPIVSGKKRVHTTQKPVKLMKDLIEIFTNEHDTVLDPFMGSGSTGVACKETNRNFIGIELDKEYFNVAQKRINKGE